jgi:hypothetical protein
MAKKISASVGKGGQNNAQDVLIIRNLLAWHKQWFHPNVVKSTGAYDKALGDAIELFQKKACSLTKTDGRVDPNGFTLSRLNILNIPKPNHPIFNVCYNVNTAALKDSDYSKVATLLNCEVEAIKAVAIVETKRGAWDNMGRPTILFERHYFRNLTSKKYNKTHPDISGSPGGYGRFSAQYPKLNRAAVLDQSAALQSASWGKFQIMGKYFKQAGYSSVSAFVDDMMVSELKHLNAFANFTKNDKRLLNAIQKKDWTKFASIYNGPDYKKNNYDTKMETEYKALKLASAAKTTSKPTATNIIP